MIEISNVWNVLSYRGIIMIGTLITNFGRCYEKHSLDGTGKSTTKVL